MAQNDDYEILEGVKSARIPIFGFLAYPLHIAFVPQEAFALNLGVGILASFSMGIATGEIVNPIVLAVSTIAGHAWLAMKYYQDRHFVAVWRARYLEGKPLPPIVKLPSVLKPGRGINRFS